MDKSNIKKLLNYKRVVKLMLLLILSASFIYIYTQIISRRYVNINNEKVYIELVDTNELRQNGLSGRSNLDKDSGILFDFQTDDYYCFWMKDMKFTIDMIWINSHNKVVDVKKEVKPDTYPEQFCPDNKARYVLEINSGQAEQLNIQSGTYIKL